MSRRSPLGSAVATTRGDDGTTGLLFGSERVAKDDPRVEAYGTVDEAVAALGLARAELVRARDLSGEPDLLALVVPALGPLDQLVLRYQRELFVVGAELAANPAARDRLADGRTRVSEAMLRQVEADLGAAEQAVPVPREFVVPGETRASAGLEMARAVLRRAERRVIALRGIGFGPGEYCVPYLNRLADLIWVLARVAELTEARSATAARRPEASHRRESST
jgi:cob(I)alamin adenosyltransferase